MTMLGRLKDFIAGQSAVESSSLGTQDPLRQFTTLCKMVCESPPVPVENSLLMLIHFDL